ncbi:MAG: BrxA/BrxB family bacilliredoxin [Gemmatimonadaceae bacterium]
MYPEALVHPMRAELTQIGFEELRTPGEVDQKLTADGTTLVVVNSICGCAARMARPAVRIALQQSDAKPDHLTTVFAGQEKEATDRARSYFTGYPPSSPSIALLRDGQIVFMLERWQIEGRPAPEIARDLTAAFEEHCAT